MLLEGTNNNTNGIICPKCGAVNLEDARFCESCGTDLGTAAGGAGEQNIPLGVNPQAQNSQYGNAVPSQSAGQDHSAPSQNLGQGGMVSSQGYGQGGPASGPYGSMPSQPQPAVKKPVPKWVPVLIAEAALLALCIYGITMSAKNSNNPERVAETFFVHMANGDWEEGYSKLDAEDSEFINAKMFASANARNSTLGVVTNYQLDALYNGQGLDQLSQSVYDLAGSLGLEDYLEQESSSSLEQAFKVDYRAKGNNDSSTYLIMLNQTPEGWKVGASNFIRRDYCIYVPKGFQVRVDGIVLGESYLIPEGEEGYDGDGYRDSYSIPQIFYGVHEIEITMEDMEDVSETIEIGYGDSQYSLDRIQLKEEVRDMLIQKAGENMQQIYNAAMAGKNFSSIENLIFSDKEFRQKAKEEYEELLADMNEGDTLPTRVIFQNIEGESDSSDSIVFISFSYQVEYKYENWSGGWTESQYDGIDSWYFGFRKENGEWVQTSLGCETLYY